MIQAPAGTVTFLFTDIEGSTRVWQQHPEAMPAALRRHHALLSESIAAHGGYVFQIIGDAFCAAFSTAGDGLAAALAAQRSLAGEAWGETGALRVRMALHTGSAQLQVGEFTSGEYASGLTLSRAARLLSAGHGGQILLSLATAELVRDHLPTDTTLRDLGPRRLKDLIRPEQIFQVVASDLPADFAPLKTLDVHPHNLPVQLTSFIGREAAMDEIKRLFPDTHLLTVTGIGGAGKTRLALQVAADLIDDFPGGVWFVELAPLHDPALVPQTVASALGLHVEPDRPLVESLVDHLREKHLLLILDNCEHVAGASARLAAKLLGAAPQLKILATSRVSLNLAGETLYPVPPLSLPDSRHVTPPLAMTQYEAVRLFIERGRAVQPAFGVTNANAPAVAQICQHLDGIPLAIELAAARIRLLSPDEIAARLGDRFNLLTGGSRTALPRHQTLRATMDWSYDLLTGAERTLFNRLAVFAGSFSLESVEAVCADASDGGALMHAIRPSQALDLLGALVDHSLVIVEERKAETRYGLLETVRQYALERGQAVGEWPSLQDRHLAHYLVVAEQGAPHIFAGHPVWTDRFEAEYDNFRVAMAVALARNPQSAILLGRSLHQFVYFGPRVFESYDWAMRILDLTKAWPPSRMRATALWLAGDHALAVGDLQRGQELLEASLDMANELGDKHQMALSLHDLAGAHMFLGNWEQMKHYADQLTTISLELGDTYFITAALWLSGYSAQASGDGETARVHLERCLAMARQEDLPNSSAHALLSLAVLEDSEGNLDRAIGLGMECVQIWRQMKYQRGLVSALLTVGRLSLQEGDALQAKALFEEALAISKELKMFPEQAACLGGLAGLAGLAGKDERAVRLFGAFEAVLEQREQTMIDLSHRAYDQIIAVVRERLSPVDFSAAWVAGRKMTLEEALEYAQAPNDP